MISVQGKGEFLFIHGAGLNSDVWKKQAELGYRIDLPGHGKSEDRDIRSIRDYAEVVIETVDSLAINPIIVGHSMGGAIAQEYVRLGGKARGLVLMATGAKLSVNPVIIEKLKEDFEAFVNKLVNWMFFKDFKGKAKDFVRDIILSTGLDVTLRDFMLCDKFDLERDYLRGFIIELPTLIIVGNEDVMTPPSLSEFLRERIPDSRLAVINKAGHMVFLEKANEVNTVLKEFLKTI